MVWACEVFNRLYHSHSPRISAREDCVAADRLTKRIGSVVHGMKDHHVHVAVVLKAAHAFHLFTPLFSWVDAGFQTRLFYQFLPCNDETNFIQFNDQIEDFPLDRVFAIFRSESLSAGEFEYFQATLNARLLPIADTRKPKILVVTSDRGTCSDSRYRTDFDEDDIREARIRSIGLAGNVSKVKVVRSQYPGSGKSTRIRREIAKLSTTDEFHCYFVNESH
jgi:hypothetical protein